MGFQDGLAFLFVSTLETPRGMGPPPTMVIYGYF
jgi:hypothetical protein